MRREDWESELDAELEGHCRERASELMRNGVAPAAASRQARLELGMRESYKQQCREVRGYRWRDELAQDLRFAARLLRRSPGFAAIAIISLMLGVGVNLVVFGVANALIFKPLAIAHPEQVLFLAGNRYPTHSFPNYLALRSRNRTLSGIAGYRMAPMGLATRDGARRVWGYLATSNYFDVLGVRPIVGRFFRPTDDRVLGGSPEVVLSESCWHLRFGGDPGIIGRTVRINDHPFTVLGVAPASFHGTELFYWPEVWVPMTMQPQIEGGSWLDSPGTFNTMVVGRLAPGVSVPQATLDVDRIAAQLAREEPKWNSNLSFRFARPGLIGDTLGGPVRTFAAGVLILAALVLLAACANLAGLLTARAQDRQQELTMRLALGAGRARLVRQLVAESLLLSLLGGAAGLGLAVVLLRLLSHWRAPLDFPVQFAVEPDLRVLGVALLVAVGTGLLFGTGPARLATRAARLGSRPAPAGRARRWAGRDIVLAVQVMLCCVLVTASFAAIDSLSRALTMDLGEQPRQVAVVSADLGLSGYGAETAAQFQQRTLAAIERLPGVIAASYANSLPLSIDQSSTALFREDTADFRNTNALVAQYYQIAPGYLRTVGTRLLAGRDVSWHDTASVPRVAIINQVLADRLFGPGRAIGRRFRRSADSLVEVIGVVENGKYQTLSEAPQPAVFWPILQVPNTTTVFVARTAGAPLAFAEQMRRRIALLDPRLPLHGVGGMDGAVAFALLPARAAGIALGSFGLLALMLALTGIYGLAAYSVSRRLKEIGVRLAIGARPAQLLRSVLGRAWVLLAAGSAVGLALGSLLVPALVGMLAGGSGSKPGLLLAVALTMAAVGLLAAWRPARRALAVDAMEALRSD